MIQGTPEPITTSVPIDPVPIDPVPIDPVLIDEDTILADVVGMLVEVIGDDFLLEGEVAAETTFSDDLAVESIEFVALAEHLRERYGDRVDFVAFVGGLELDEIMSMTVGHLVTHIHQRLNQNDPIQNDLHQNDLHQNGADHG